MDDKKAFKILAAISVTLCIFIVLFNSWIGPAMVPTYKEYKKIFNLSYKNKDDIAKDFSDEYVYDDEDNDEEDDDEEILVININEADIDELMMIPNIGEVLADRIISYREEYGLFESKEELLNVEGIGQKKLEAMIDYISLE